MFVLQHAFEFSKLFNFHFIEFISIFKVIYSKFSSRS